MQTWCGLHTPPRDYFLEFIILYFTPIRGIKFMFHENKKNFCQLLKKYIYFLFPVIENQSLILFQCNITYHH